jgi:hypothetical protein
MSEETYLRLTKHPISHQLLWGQRPGAPDERDRRTPDLGCRHELLDRTLI